MLNFKSMTQRIVTVILLLLIVVCAGMGVISYKMSANTVTKEVEAALLTFSKQSANEIMSELERDLDVLEIAAYLELIKSSEVEIEEKLSVLQSVVEISNFQNMGIADITGNLYLMDGKKTKNPD
jgi:cell division protein YceG involved in septum cleavage